MNIIWFPILAILAISLKAQSDIQMPLVYDFVMALGTSVPELTISVMSAIDGNPGTAIGNVVGSNILNTLLIIGVVELARPVRIEKGIMVNEIPMAILAERGCVCDGHVALDRRYHGPDKAA